MPDTSFAVPKLHLVSWRKHAIAVDKPECKGKVELHLETKTAATEKHSVQRSL